MADELREYASPGNTVAAVHQFVKSAVASEKDEEHEITPRRPRIWESGTKTFLVLTVEPPQEILQRRKALLSELERLVRELGHPAPTAYLSSSRALGDYTYRWNPHLTLAEAPTVTHPRQVAHLQTNVVPDHVSVGRLQIRGRARNVSQ